MNDSNDVDVRVIINDDELICVILGFRSERNFSDYNNVFNSYNSGNVYDVYGYGYVT